VLPHNYFVVEAAAVGSEGWRELLAWRGDEGAPIRREQVHIVNDRIACAFAGTKYVVTTDAGATWIQWDALESSTRFLYPRQTFIRNATVSSDGHGVLVVDIVTGTDSP
jgi:hypothetical protein